MSGGSIPRQNEPSRKTRHERARVFSVFFAVDFEKRLRRRRER
jgi:hypothetical protein